MVNEKELVLRAKNGEIRAFEELVAEYQSVVFNVALKILCNHDDAADMAQEALIKAFKNISRFEGKSKFSTWLYKITYNVCIDDLRRNKKMNVRSIDETYDDGDDAIIEPVDPAPTPEESYISKERAQFLHAAIDSLSPEHRTAIIMRDVNGFSYEEIAKIQGCSLGTIKSRINRARNQLKDIIANRELINAK